MDLAPHIMPKDQKGNSDLVFEKDITEAVGFQNGYKPWLDIISYQNTKAETTSETQCGMLGLITTLYMVENFEKMFDKYAGTQDDQENTLMLNIMDISQNQQGEIKLDGFPIILVIFEIVANCINLIEDKMYIKDVNIYQKKEQQYWRHQQKVFRLIAQRYFNNNMYDTFNEYVYHMIMNFVLAWRESIERCETHLQWNIQQLE